MRISEIEALPDWILLIKAEDGRIGSLDVQSLLEFEAFEPLKDQREFSKIINGGYFVEWDCGADLSADTIEARWNLVKEVA